MTVLRSFVPDLPRKVWVVLAGDALSAFGSGLVLPFLVIYLRDARGIPVDTAALVVSTIAVVGLAGGPASGWVVDRLGSRRAMITSLLINALGSAAIAGAESSWQAFAAAAVFGIGTVMMWPASHSLLISIVDAKERSSVFSVHYMTLNAGIGVGGIVGGLVANVSEPLTFELLYLADALTFLAFAALLLRLKDVGPPHSREGRVEGVAGYRQVLRDRLFLRICLLGVLLVTIGYAQLESGFPAFATGQGGIGTRALGFSFAVNTAVIVVGQLVVLRKMNGRRRTRAVAAMSILWAAAWIVTVLAGNVGGALAVAGFVAAMAVFALGETFMSPSLPAIVNDLASDDLRGRYNAAYSMSWSLGHMVGPAVAGVLLARGLGNVLFAGLVVACVAAAVAALRLERHLPESANRVGGGRPGAPGEDATLLHPLPS